MILPFRVGRYLAGAVLGLILPVLTSTFNLAQTPEPRSSRQTLEDMIHSGQYNPTAANFRVDEIFEWSGSSTAPFYNKTVGYIPAGDVDGDGTSDFAANTYVSTFTGNIGGVIRVFSGKDFSVIYEVTDPSLRSYRRANPTIVNINGVGGAEVLYLNMSQSNIICLNPDGSPRWISDPLQSTNTDKYSGLIYAFEDKLVINRDVLDALTGILLFTVPSGDYGTRFHPNPLAGDLDPSRAGQEILVGDTAYYNDGTFYATNTSFPGGLNAIADFDLDGIAEVVRSTSQGLAILYNDFSTRNGLFGTPSIGFPGHPWVGDITGDGIPEIGVSSFINSAVPIATYVMWDVSTGTPTRLWEMDITASASIAATSADIHDYGKVLFLHDREYVYILDASTGSLLWADVAGSQNSIELVSVGNFNRDCNLKFIVTLNGETSPTPDAMPNGFRVYTIYPDIGMENANPPGKIWPNYSYNVTNVNPDCSIPMTPTPSWQANNDFFTQTTTSPPVEIDIGDTLMANKPNTRDVFLYWLQVSGVDYYLIKRGMDPSIPLISYLTTPPSIPNFTDYFVQNDGVFLWCYLVVGKQGCNPYGYRPSDSDPQMPFPPENYTMTATESAFSNSTLTNQDYHVTSTLPKPNVIFTPDNAPRFTMPEPETKKPDIQQVQPKK